jgi:hypothetical protein
MKRLLGVMGMIVGLAGCPASNQVNNVEKAARNLARGLPEQSRLLMCTVASPTQCQGMPVQGDRDVIRAGIRDNATLACEIATHDRSDAAATAPECKCSSAKSNEEFEAACGAWAGVK